MSERNLIHPGGVDLDRGAIMTKHKSRPGGYICMYADEPGVYFDDMGYEVSARIAQEAGFDVKKDITEGLLQKRMNEIKAKLEAAQREGGDSFMRQLQSLPADKLVEFADAREKVMEQKDAEPNVAEYENSEHITKRGPKDQPRETKYHRLVHRGAGFWKVLDETGEVVLDNVREGMAIEFIVLQAEEIEANEAAKQDESPFVADSAEGVSGAA